MPSFNAYIRLIMVQSMDFLLEPDPPVNKRILLRGLIALIYQAEAVLDAEEKKR